jgi:hypothetical protein
MTRSESAGRAPPGGDYKIEIVCSADRDYAREPSEVATVYRVTLWEQPAGPPNIDRPRIGWSPYPGAPMGWEQMTFDLVGAQDVREAIQWADATLASNESPAPSLAVRYTTRST